MPITVAKEFRWEMGHRLPYHETCKNIHGHSYRMMVEVTGEVDDSGMVIDFGDISTIVRPLIEAMDHSFMVDPSDKLMLEVLSTSGLKRTEVGFYSTAENIAHWILSQVCDRLFTKPLVSRVRVEVYETATSSACASSDRPSGIPSPASP